MYRAYVYRSEAEELSMYRVYIFRSEAELRMYRVCAFWAETEELRVRDVGLRCVSIKQRNS